MTLKSKLYTLSISLHAFLLVISLTFHRELGGYTLLVELGLITSLLIFIKLIKKAIRPLDYISTFSNLLKEEEFNSRFSSLNQPELDKLIEQFNLMLEKLYEERLRVGEQRSVFQKLMEESPVGVLILDFDNNISELNPAIEHIFKVSRQQVVGRKLTSLPSTDFERLGDISTGEHDVLTTHNGSRLKVGHFKLVDRGFSRSFYMVTELTGDLLRAQKAAYENLIRLMSHEVNNTIAITNSLLEDSLHYKEQLQENDKEDFEEALSLVINRGKSLNQFMKSYADVVKLPQPIKSKYNFSSQIRNLVKLFFSECNNRKIRMESNIAENIEIIADAHQIEQALVNIIKNAIESIEHGGTIFVDLSNSEKSTSVSVKDTGAGLSKEAKENLFAPFYTTKRSGQGVGLMLVSEVLKAHDFSFSLENRKGSSGACFKIEI